MFYGNNIKSNTVMPLTREIFMQLIDSEQLRRLDNEQQGYRQQSKSGKISIDEYKQLLARNKRNRPYITTSDFHDDATPDAPSCKRLNANARWSGFCSLDIDHVSSPLDIYEQKIKGHETALGITAVFISPSYEGLKIIFRIPKTIDNANAQKAMARTLGVEYDPATKDPARATFLVSRERFLYLDIEKLFSPTPTSPIAINWSDSESTEAPLPKLKQSHDMGERPSTDIALNLPIVERAMQMRKITPCDFEQEGKRHFTLMNLLSSGVTRVMSEEALWQCIATIAPTYSHEADARQLVKDWYAKYNSQLRPVTMIQAKAFQSGPTSQAHEILNAQEYNNQMEAIIMRLNSQLPTFPEGLKESIEYLPDKLKLPAICSLMPLCGAYADGVVAYYADGKPHHIGLMSIIIGEQASNKSMCKDVIDLWKLPMQEDDQAQRKIEDEWKERHRNRKANEKGEPDPKAMIREVPITISCSTLLRRFKNSRGHCLYSFGEELDTLRKTNGAGSWSSKYDIYRLAFDRGEWGQDYNSDQAESGIVNVAYNWTILGTYGAFRKCMRQDNIENGLSSRLMIAEMPDNRFAQLAHVHTFTQEEQTHIINAVVRLRTINGVINSKEISDVMAQWVETKRMEALEENDVVKDTYRKRAAVIGFRCGIIFQLLQANAQDDSTAAMFAQLMADYVLMEQCKLFGVTLNESIRQNEEFLIGNSSVNRNIYNCLPSTFTFDHLSQLKQGSYNSCRSIISRWIHNNLIRKIDDNTWQKTPH